jgi:hypothetical protein
MNIFVLDLDVEKCAHYHCDKHVVKMILESTQIICTVLNKKGFSTPYKATHINHPCVLWAEKSFANLQWLKKLAKALNKEYCYRYKTGKGHSSVAVINKIDNLKFESAGLTDFAQVMPEKYKVCGDPVQAYRNYYMGEKLQFAQWTRRRKPVWINRIINE